MRIKSGVSLLNQTTEETNQTEEKNILKWEINGQEDPKTFIYSLLITSTVHLHTRQPPRLL